MLDKSAIGAGLRTERDERNWSRAELARRLRAAASPDERQRLPATASLGSMIKGWEGGLHLPGRNYQVLYGRVFDVRPELLFSPSGPADLLREEGRGGLVQLLEQFQQLDERYLTSPSSMLLGHASRLHGQIGALREQSRPGVGRRGLYSLEARSATLLSTLVWDASQRRDHSSAQAHLDEAIAAARAADDAPTEAYAVLRSSFLALYGRHDPATGIAHAKNAAKIAGPSSRALQGLALLHAAEGHARQSDRGKAEAALGFAEMQIDRVTADDPSAAWLTHAEYARVAGSAYLALGLPALAEPLLRRISTEARGKNTALARANLALALIRQRKLEEGTTSLHEAIADIRTTLGGGALALIFTARRELRPWHNEHWVHELDDALFDLMSP